MSRHCNSRVVRCRAMTDRAAIATIATSAPARGGRPERRRHSRIVNFRISDQLAADLGAVIEQTGAKQSDVIRAALVYYIESKRHTAAPVYRNGTRWLQ